MKLNEKIVYCRKRAGLSQEALAEKQQSKPLNNAPADATIGGGGESIGKN